MYRHVWQILNSLCMLTWNNGTLLHCKDNYWHWFSQSSSCTSSDSDVVGNSRFCSREGELHYTFESWIMNCIEIRRQCMLLCYVHVCSHFSSWPSCCICANITFCFKTCKDSHIQYIPALFWIPLIFKDPGAIVHSDPDLFEHLFKEWLSWTSSSRRDPCSVPAGKYITHITNGVKNLE